MTKRLRSFLGPALLVGASTFFAVVMGEIVVRLFFGPIPATMDERAVTYSMYEPHDKVGWRPRPNMSMRSKHFNATFITNSRGLRDRERDLAKPPGLRRIVVIGDSFTWGWGVDQNETFPKVLESQLQRTDVINLGVAGYGLRQAFDYLKVEGILYEPEIVIFALCQNDIYRSSSLPQRSAPDSRAPNFRRTSSDSLGRRIKIWLSEHLVLYRVAQQAINTNRRLIRAFVAIGLKDDLEGFEGLDPNLMPALRKYPPELQTSYETTQEELLEIRDWLAAQNIRFILALIPALQAIDGRAFIHSIAYTVFEPMDFELEKPYKALEAFARSNSIEVINTYPALKQRQQAGATLYLPNDVHFNPLGQQVFAAQIQAYLQ